MWRFSRFVACALLLTAAGCGGRKGGGTTDGGSIDATCATTDGGTKKPNGQACGCAADCQSGFCVGGLCCNSACTDTCKTCNDQSAPGICTLVPSGGQAPPGSCPMGAASTCGLDGTCDGKGNCRRYPAGTVCMAGTCDGASVSDVNVCDGEGHCKSGPATICVPYNCDPTTNKCATSCETNTDCASGVLCVNGSCGLKPNGAVCTANSECKSTFCADGVCCNVACKGACISCNQPGRGGTCWPVDAGGSDPHSVCAVQAPATCGTTGACDGFGGCAKFASQIICIAPACSGDRLNTAGTCDGLGSCLPPGMQNCDPYRCLNGACINKCASDADCVTGHACQAGSCGKKTNGQPCTMAGDCVSNHCVDGVCCDQACAGPCRSCALLSSLGTCTPVSNGADDPRNMCTTQAASTCGTDGKCDGAGGCRKYRSGTVCAAEHCDSGVYTPEATCSTTGACVAPDAMSCVPYVCNGSKCFGSCTADANCSTGNFCVGNSCGPKPIGAFCSAGSECGSGNCAQGVCCATACATACKSCALSSTRGACTNVPAASPDPSQTCVDKPGTCDTNGKCEAGACQRYAQGTPCGAASCPSSGFTLTSSSACDGAGACVTPPPSSCYPFMCGVAACKSTCTADGDCAPPNVCNGGSCGLRPIGASCAGAVDCQSNFCAQGVCCATACTGSCTSCALVGTLGMCKPVTAGGTDPKGQCMVEGATTCGKTGLCDGAGGCQLYAAGTQCAPPTCPTGTATATLARTCDGAGTCRPATTQSCGAYACNGTTCNAACAGNSDCAANNVCNSGMCGLKRLGQLCAAGSECDSGNCTDGVCCMTGPCGTCQSCNVVGLAGTCNKVPDGDMEPHGGCTPSPPCGNTGKCDGNGACRSAPATTSCGTAMCSGSTFKPVGNCDGMGACSQPSMSCGAYACNGTTSCNTMCGGDNDCASGFTCMSNVCTNLKANGTMCAAGAECFSGNCTEGYCCDKTAAVCGTCMSCKVASHLGSCWPVPMGGSDPLAGCMNMAVATCGTTGTCNGAGQCATYAPGTMCMPSTCAASTLTTYACNGGGACVPQMTDCTPFACDGSSACKMSCVDDNDCAATLTCTAPTCGP
ncbi:MAG TPA: hypothetical protein VKQ32_04195 [Polyangia bacterium]|nr:hypothetical protein [Polyangia bacterium]